MSDFLRERLTRAVTLTCTHKHVGIPEFAAVTIAFAPRDAGFAFEDESGLEREYAAAVETALRVCAARGPAAGHPLTGLAARLTGGQVHPMDSSPRAFALAASGAFAKLETEIVEPWMQVEAVLPADILAGAAGDLAARGAQGMRVTGDDPARLAALAPAARLMGHEEALRAMSAGRARCTLRFSHYAPMGVPDPRP